MAKEFRNKLDQVREEYTRDFEKSTFWMHVLDAEFLMSSASKWKHKLAERDWKHNVSYPAKLWFKSERDTKLRYDRIGSAGKTRIYNAVSVCQLLVAMGQI